MAFIEPVIRTSTKLRWFEVRNLYLNLLAIKTVKDNDLNYAITRTIDHIKGIAEAVSEDKRIPISEEFKSYTEKYQELRKKLANSKVKTVNGQEDFDIDYSDGSALKALDKLKDEFKDAIKERESDVEVYNKWIQNECPEEVKLHKISKDKMPDGTDTSVWLACAPIISEEPVTKDTK